MSEAEGGKKIVHKFCRGKGSPIRYKLVLSVINMLIYKSFRDSKS